LTSAQTQLDPRNHSA